VGNNLQECRGRRHCEAWRTGEGCKVKPIGGLMTAALRASKKGAIIFRAL
jgi:hypothetical protein